jgi:tetratricopeptide (TPR) repeat protein
MYQPKWGGDPVKLVKVARMMVGEYLNDQSMIEVFRILRRVGQPWLAVKLERRMIRHLLRTPDDVWSHYIIAFIHMAAGRKEEAVREFRTVVRMRTKQFDSHFALGRYARADGRIDEAIREYRAALGSGQINLADAHYNLARAYRANKQHDEALEEVYNSLEAAPTYKPAQQLLLELNANPAAAPKPERAN